MTEIIFKDWRTAFEFDSLDKKLKQIVAYAITTAADMGIARLVVTSIQRDDGGVHSTHPVRGIDLVPEDRDVTSMETIRSAVNDEWDYGKQNSSIEVCPPVRHGTAPHVHLQCRDETTRREVSS